MNASAPGALGQESKLGSVWGPARVPLGASATVTSLSSAARLRATLLGLLISVLALVVATAVALLIVAVLFTSIGNLG